MKKHLKLGLFKSKGRLNSEAISKYRSPFQRDRDRIIHSASFRRLKHKTQVFVNTEGCLLYTSPSPRDVEESRMPSSA